MKYKVGDKVRIREDLVVDKTYGKDWCFVKSMSEFKGKISTIREVRKSSYLIDIDKGEWAWTDEMFEPVITNWDKVKEKIGEITLKEINHPNHPMCKAIHRIKNEEECKGRACSECMDWLKQPYKEPSILDEAEKKYLSNVIRPWRDKIEGIQKHTLVSNNEFAFIQMVLHNDWVTLPNFKKDTMYKGMELNKEYTLDELEI